jgi:hypothetical protein
LTKRNPSAFEIVEENLKKQQTANKRSNGDSEQSSKCVKKNVDYEEKEDIDNNSDEEEITEEYKGEEEEINKEESKESPSNNQVEAVLRKLDQDGGEIMPTEVIIFQYVDIKQSG